MNQEYIDEIEKEKIEREDLVDNINEDKEDKENEENEENEEEIKNPYAVTIELGDIIEVVAPTNIELHESSLYVTYIDEYKVLATNIATLEKIQLNINNERFTDESIRQIAILSRSETAGYARQNGLVLGVWVDIHFGGEFPTIITGEITNLEEDQIEITTFPDLDAIYIDFEYKGLPELIPIREIVIRPKPSVLNKTDLKVLREGKENGELFVLDELLKEDKTVEDGENKEVIQGDTIKLKEKGEINENIYDNLRSLCQKSTIVFGKYLDTVTQIVEVKEEQKRYHIDIQLNSLLDEYLSTVPNYQRTKSFMSEIHILIERFRELRTMFSRFDENSDIKSLFIKGPTYKPILEHIYQLDLGLKWLIPVVSIIKKIYKKNEGDIQDRDIAEYNIIDTLTEEEKIKDHSFYKNYSKINEVKYVSMHQQIHDFQTPFLPPENYNEIFLCDKEVQTNLEAIVDNLGDFYSTVMNGKAMSRRRYAIQTYNLGLSHIKPHMEKGTSIYMTMPMTPSDRIHIKSMITMPMVSMEYSRVNMPSTNIMDRVNLSHKQYLLFRIFKKNKKILPHIIDDLSKELNYEGGEEAFLSNMKEFILSDDTGVGDNSRFHKFLDVIIPKTNYIIRMMQKHMIYKLSFYSIVSFLEPFGIELNDITFSKYFNREHKEILSKSSYGEIRSSIETAMNNMRKTYKNKSTLFDQLIKKNKPTIELLSVVKLLIEKKENLDLMLSSYKLPNKDIISMEMTSPEVLGYIIQKDQGKLFSLLISSLMSTLYMPNNLNLYGKDPKEDDMSDIEKIKPKDCVRKVLAKKYTSIGQLQKDNGHIDVFYDKDYDDTPYDLINKYKEEKKKMLPEDFPEFLIENLVQKHDCPIEIAPELATTLITGKRAIKEGEYAILELRPHLPEGVDESSIDEKTKQQIVLESDIRVKYQYYRRVKDHWVQDRDIDETAFLDNNAIFCNIQPDCMKVDFGCISNESAADRVRRIASKKAHAEFENRIDIGVKEIEENILSEITKQLKRIVKLNVLTTIQTEKTNYLANSIGTQADKTDILISPYTRLRDLIMGQPDFTKKQTDIVMFAELYTRDAMIETLGENKAWKYCLVTNTPLLPTFLYDLANTFISGGNYTQLLDEITAKIGTISDDGDSIVDKETGYVIRKIDFSIEEGFSEEGFQIKTNSIMEKDLGTVMMENLKKERVFVNETSEMVYKIASFLSSNIGLPIDSIYDFVHMLSIELIQKNITSEEAYRIKSEKLAKTKNIKTVPYIKYKNESIILIVSSILFISIQTAIPTFFTKRTYPGCVRSFDGYPFTGIEDLTGIKYMACILEKSKSSIEPWDSIKGMKSNILCDRIKGTIERFLINHPKIEEAYLLKKQYIESNPNPLEQEHAVEKWYTFLPPLINIEITKNIKGIGDDFRTELMEDIRKGNKRQNQKSLVLKSKVIQFTAAIIENIQNIVYKKDIFLKTSANEPFLQNACCNEKEKSLIPILYFANEDEGIKTYLKAAKKCEELSYMIKEASKAAFFYYSFDTRPIKPQIQSGIIDQNIYETIIHYLELDTGLPIPTEFHSIMQECPAGYNTKWSIIDKIEFLKRRGKRFDENQFLEVMRIVEKRNIIEPYRRISTDSPVDSLRDILELFTQLNKENESRVPIDKGLIENISILLKKYQPKAMHTIDQEKNKELFNIKNYLVKANTKMHTDIMSFFDQYGNLSNQKFKEIDSFLKNLTTFHIEEDITQTNKSIDMGLFQISKFVKNSLYDIIRVLPNIILNDVNIGEIPKYWGLSQDDESDLHNFIHLYLKPLSDFRQDHIIHDIIQEIQLNTIDIHLFIKNIPVYNPILHEKNIYYSLFDKRAVYLLLSYAFYSILYEYITVANNDKYLKKDTINSKTERRQKLRDSRDKSQIETDFLDLDELYESGYEGLDEVQIDIGNQMDLKERIAKVLLGYLTIVEENKSYANYSYDMIEKKVRKSREREKKMITDRFKNISVDERKIENMMKQYKIGKWNVGQQKGLVVYDVETSDRERKEMLAREEKEEIVIEFDLINNELEEVRDEDNIADIPENQFQIDYDMQTDIKGMNQNYNDGVFYDEDGEEDFMPDD